MQLSDLFEMIQTEWDKLVVDPEIYMRSKETFLCNFDDDDRQFYQHHESERSLCRLIENRTNMDLSIIDLKDFENVKAERNYDIIIGFYSSTSTTVSVIIEDSAVIREMCVDNWCFALDNLSIIPDVSLGYVQSKFNTPTPDTLKLILAILDTKSRKIMRQSDMSLPLSINNDEGRFFVIENGAGKCFHNAKKNQMFPLMNWRNECKKKQNEIRMIEEELIEKAWHPSRLFWCLDLNDRIFTTV